MLPLIYEGHTYGEIADRLGITPRMVADRA
jgi:DNA-binding CsgD family transcriptional regulator